jgi:dCMP deaminase
MMNNKWDVRFLDLARHIAQWSKDPSTKCGAVIVDYRRIVSVGFNGFAPGTDDSDELYNDRAYKLENVIHCEENAIIQAQESLRGCVMYLTGAGCSRCTARVIAAGIDRVVIPCREEDAFTYRPDGELSWDASFEMARKQLTDAGVFLRVVDPTGYDPKKLMGPQHPHVVQLNSALNDAKTQALALAQFEHTPGSLRGIV